MVDTRDLKTHIDLRRVVEQDLGPAPKHGGQALLWKCPFHGEKHGHSLAVWADGFRCFGACQVQGDVIDWLIRYRRMGFGEVVAFLENGSTTHAATVPALPTESPEHDVPPLSWQASARQVVDCAEETLWSSRGEETLEYLTGRGLALTTIESAHLGVIPGGHKQWRQIAGLNVPCGITIPWLTNAEETLWAVKVRREKDFPKYVQIAGGSRGGLYQADRLKGAPAVLFCEGEFDTLLAQQEAGDLVSAVTLGSASVSLSRRWLPDLLHIPIVLVAYDADEAGERGAARLLGLSERANRVHVPRGKDLTEYHLDGGSLYSWLSRELRQVRAAALELGGRI